MNIVNIVFTGISASKTGVPKSKMNISNNMRIDSVEEVKMPVDKTKVAMKIEFTYSVSYDPDFAKIELKGDVLAIDEEKQARKILDKFKKDKILEKDVALVLMNSILNKCSIEAIVMARELGLPSPIKLPGIKASDAPAAPAKKKQ